MMDVLNGKFFDDDFGTNHLWKIDFKKKKRFPEVQTYSIVKWHAVVAAHHGTRIWNRCWLTGNERQSPTVIRFHFSKFS